MEDKPEIILYCDGSSSPKTKEGGYAAVLVNARAALLVKGSEKNTTNNRMEITAALRGLESLTEAHYVYLVSDSAYLINTLKHKWYENWNLFNSSVGPSRKNSDLWERMIEQINIHTIYPLWVRGHAKINPDPYNDLVDKIAVTARKESSPETIEEIDIGSL